MHPLKGHALARRTKGSSHNPLQGEGEIEIRQVFEASDFGPALIPELREQEERLRAPVAKKP